MGLRDHERSRDLLVHQDTERAGGYDTNMCLVDRPVLISASNVKRLGYSQ